MIRKMVGVSLLDGRTNEWLEETVKLPDIRKEFLEKKGHG